MLPTFSTSRVAAQQRLFTLILRRFLLSIILMLGPFSAQASTLPQTTVTSSGVTYLRFNGTRYNVAFVGGTCYDVFDGCTEYSDFPFARENVNQASDALRDVLHSTQTQASQINGCEIPDNYGYCSIYTPTSRARYYDEPRLDDNFYTVLTSNIVIGPKYAQWYTMSDGALPKDWDFGKEDYGHVWAVWTLWSPSATPPLPSVPLPAGGMLMFTGLAGLAALRRWKRNGMRV